MSSIWNLKQTPPNSFFSGFSCTVQLASKIAQLTDFVLSILRINMSNLNWNYFFPKCFHVSDGPPLNHRWPGMGAMRSPWSSKAPWQHHHYRWTEPESQYGSLDAETFFSRTGGTFYKKIDDSRLLHVIDLVEWLKPINFRFGEKWNRTKRDIYRWRIEHAIRLIKKMVLCDNFQIVWSFDQTQQFW